MKIKTLILLSLPFLLNLHAEECSSIIALSKTTSSTVKSKDTFERHVNNFCSEYSRATGSNRSSQYGISYKFLSLSMGSNSANSESLASKYCSASDSTESSNDAYKEYIETISPYAYSAYQSCLDMSKNNLKFKLDMASLLPKRFSLFVQFNSNSQEDATLSFFAPEEVSCSWHQFDTPTIAIPSGSTALLNCSRKNSQQRTYVQVFRTNASTTPISIPWGAYDKNGVPIDMIRELEKKYKKLLSENENLQNSLKGSVTAFNSDECPTGWKEYTLAYGRFIRGLDKSGNIDPDKNRKIGSTQEDSFKKHNHNNGGYNLLFKNNGEETIHTTDNRGSEPNLKTTAGIQSRGGKETRPKNIALLYCIKK